MFIFFTETNRQLMEQETCRLKILLWYTKVVELNFSKNQN